MGKLNDYLDHLSEHILEDRYLRTSFRQNHTRVCTSVGMHKLWEAFPPDAVQD